MAKASQLIASFGLLGFIRVMISMQSVGYKYLVSSFSYHNSQLQKKQVFFYLNSLLTFESC